MTTEVEQKIEELRSNHKYCSKCGRKLEEVRIEDGFSQKNGKKRFVVYLACPKQSGFFSYGHDEIYLYTAEPK